MMRTKLALPLLCYAAVVLPSVRLSPAAEPATQPVQSSAAAAPQAAAAQPVAASADPLSHWQALFPGGLVDASGKAVDLKTLQGKTVGVYFSAHWCPSCVAFTPDLVKFRDKNAAAFEVVFVSFDRSADDQRQYMTEKQMKGPAVECLTDPVKALQRKFEAHVIPTLVILGADGREITREGRTDIASDPDHALAKWQKAAETVRVAMAPLAAAAK
jgi:nucleoredoxin